MENLITLTLTFVEKIYKTEPGQKGRRLIDTITSDRKEIFTGKSKNDCRQQAKSNFRSGVNWEESWT